MQDRSGEVVRDYKLLELAGSGAFASVYRAEHEQLKRIRAIKIIHPTHLHDMQALRRFTAEAQVVSRLEHAHIVTLYEFWVDDRGAYIVMQWMPQGNLEQYIERVGAVAPIEVTRLLEQIAPALSLVHENDIVHRDLKPANMLFDEYGEIRLADFGLSKWLQGSSSSRSLENTVGTPAYMPPEQADPQLGIDISPQADIYSLGVILFELLIGKHPFGDAGVVEMLLHHLRDPLPSMNMLNPAIPEGLDAVIKKATAKKPEDRYPDVLALAEAFRQVAAPVHADDYLVNTSIITPPVVKAAGDLNARVYTRAGAVLENPRQLIGREKQIDLILHLLEDQSHVLLHGMAGIGKTALAGRIAAQYLNAGNKKVVWIELGRQNADSFFETLARALGQHQKVASKHGLERVLAVRELLLDQNLLIVIDNIWNETAVLPIIRAVPHAMPMLMTSRTAISIDGAMVAVEPLEDAAALDLLNKVALQQYLADSDAAKLCELLGNHPYAIEIAATHLKTYRTLTPERLMLDVQDAQQTIVITSTLGIGQQKTIKDLLDESVNELPPELRRALVRMGGFYSSRASIELLSMLLDQDEKATETQVAELERCGLVRMFFGNEAPPHYRLHDLTYAYAYNLFKAGDGARENVIKATQKFAHKNVNDYDRIDFDILNILGGARTAYNLGDTAALINIMQMLSVDSEYFAARGYSPIALELMHAAISKAENLDKTAYHFLLTKLGNYQSGMLGDFASALISYQNALKAAPDKCRRAILLSCVAMASDRLGRSDTDHYFDLAYELAKETNDDKTLSSILEQRGYIAAKQGNYQLAYPYMAEALHVAEKMAAENTKDDLVVAKALFFAVSNLAAIEHLLGNFEDAILLCDRAHTLAERQQNDVWTAMVLQSKGENYHALGQRNSALQYFQDALKLFRENGVHVNVDEITMFLDDNNYEC